MGCELTKPSSEAGAKSASATGEYDVDAVRKAILAKMEDENWDDGSYAPILIRLGWHSSGTFDKSDKTGGSNGAGMRFSPEKDDPENNGLEKARDHLEDVKKQFPSISYSDLWILAAYCALECTGGPVIEFRPGRVDKVKKEASICPGRLPGAETGLTGGQDEEGRAKGWENLAAHIRTVFTRMGINDKEIVALLCGGHLYGRCHRENSGYSGAWVEEPTKFSNEYAADMMEDEWMMVTHDTKVEGVPIPDEVRPSKGKVQYIGKWSPSEEKEEMEAIEVPESTQYPRGRYKVVDDWINCRKDTKPDSAIIAQPKEGEEYDVIAIHVFGTAIRGRLDVGGWVSIVSSKGEPLMERIGDLKLSAGKFRVSDGGASAQVRVFDEPGVGEGIPSDVIKSGLEITFDEITESSDSKAIYGKVSSPSSLAGKYLTLVSDSHGPLVERIVKGYNEVPRKAIKGRLQVGHQMMLVSDMVLLWDPEFKKYLEVYAQDEEALKKDFGEAYKKLTELGM